MIVLEVLAFAVLFCLAYLVGSIPFGLIVSKVFYRVDVRQHGSGNVGATNVFRVLGKKAGVVLALAPLAFVICFSTWIALILLTRYVSVASLTVAFMVPVLVILFRDPLPYEIAGVLLALIVWWAHRGNIRRLLNGTENRANLPWSGRRSAAPGPGGRS